MVKKQDIVEGLRRVGLKAGDVVLVHSAMCTFGPIDGGATTVVTSLQEVLGEKGTLVVPTFTFKKGEKDPIIDPIHDPSEVGAITEMVRRLPGALRSIARRHNVAAIGPAASMITQVDPKLCVFDLRSSWGKMLELDTKVLLLGMTYKISTSHHVAEYICHVPYRRTVSLIVRVRRPDGSLVKQRMTDYGPLPGTRETDSNRLGKMLEERGLVGITAIGNAVVRLFRMRDLIELGKVEGTKDYNVFLISEGSKEQTVLKDGQMVLMPKRPGPAPYQWSSEKWSVVDPKRIFSRTKQKIKQK